MRDTERLDENHRGKQDGGTGNPESGREGLKQGRGGTEDTMVGLYVFA